MARLLQLLWLGACMSSACSAGDQTDDERCTAAALYEGSPGSLGAAVDDAVAGGLLLPNATKHPAEFCTFSRVAPTWLLTAKHCVTAVEPRRVQLTFGPRFALGASAGRLTRNGCAAAIEVAGSPLKTSEILETVLHDDLDLALLHAAVPEGPSLPITESPPASGEAVLMVGYGLQETGEGGVKEALSGTIAGVEGASLRVEAVHGGACVGDSGGPLLRRGEDGAFELVGVLSSGSADCTSFDNYVDAHGARGWLRHNLHDATPARMRRDREHFAR